MEDGAQGD